MEDTENWQKPGFRWKSHLFHARLNWLLPSDSFVCRYFFLRFRSSGILFVRDAISISKSFVFRRSWRPATGTQRSTNNRYHHRILFLVRLRININIHESNWVLIIVLIVLFASRPLLGRKCNFAVGKMRKFCGFFRRSANGFSEKAFFDKKFNKMESLLVLLQ